MISCINKNDKRSFSKVQIEEIYTDSFSCRAITIKNNEVWFGANSGKYGAINLDSRKIFKGRINKDSIFPEFRSISHANDNIFLLSVANPALLYKIDKNKKVVSLVYEENDEKVFFDSMQFVDDAFGMAMGDPVANCFNVIYTIDSGENWKKINCNLLPKIAEGEAAFAASNTNLIFTNSAVYLVSGGKKSRVYVSKNRGKKWEVYNTPIQEGKAMTGIFTADFFNDKIGVVAGGNYELPNDNFANLAITNDGGKSWKLLSEGKGPGYISCIQFIPNGVGNEIVSLGATGIYYSKDSGENWKQLSKENELYTFRFLNDSVAIAAGKNKIVKMIFK